MKLAHIAFGLSLFSSTSSLASVEASAQTAPFPVFLKVGFSSVLEFDEAPSRVVLGDTQAFQVERLDRSLVLRTLVPYATSNMFVYFKDAAPKLFILTAAEDAEPTYFRKIENPKPITPTPSSNAKQAALPRTSRVLSARFDAKKDYLTVEVVIAADSQSPLRPAWELVRLRYLSSVQAPAKLWSERKEVQKDSTVRARFIFAKANVPRNLVNASLVVPLDGRATPLSLALTGGGR
jgi:hypothetical protein